MKSCPLCNEQIQDSAAVCRWCKSPVTQTVLCPACNQAISPNDPTCPWCTASTAPPPPLIPSPSGCQECGSLAPTKKVSFAWNVGLILIRMHKIIQGNLCRSCIGSTFWKCTAINLFLGWWGIISLFLTPVFLALNTVTYLGALSLPTETAAAATTVKS